MVIRFFLSLSFSLTLTLTLSSRVCLYSYTRIFSTFFLSFFPLNSCSDFGFHRKDGTEGPCVNENNQEAVPTSRIVIPEDCKPGNFFYVSRGYRKVKNICVFFYKENNLEEKLLFMSKKKFHHLVEGK